MASEFTESFLKDSAELLSAMKTGQLHSRYEGGWADAARALHSLKSGASFLGWSDVEEQAHALEGILADSGGDGIDWNAAADRLKSLIDDAVESHKGDSSSGGSVGRAVRFTELDLRVLEDSRIRGEAFYRLTCRIDPSEPLPYSRAYLLSSRIETVMTLVKADPPMDNSDADFSRPVFWLTTELPESEVFKATNVDQVDVLELVRLEYTDALETYEAPMGGISFTGKSEEDTSLIVDRFRYSETMQLAEELAWRLERQPGTPEAELSSELQKELESLAFRPLEPLMKDVGEAVERLAERRGLKARFEWNVASGGLDASTLETLGEILKQLVRNTIRHGIENPEDRAAAGKEETGILRLNVERSGSAYRFSFEDDGRGIDEEAVMERAFREGVASGTDEDELLNILCVPGFSMAEEADLDGGRGMGLEMVRRITGSEFGSDLELENQPGRGLTVRWSLPEKHMRRPYLLFVSDGRTWAIPARSVRRRGVMDSARIGISGQAYDVGGGLIPILGPMGLRPPGTVMPYFLEIHHRGRRAALLVDDLVSEEPWGAEELVPADPIGPWGRSLKDAKEGIPILSPALVYAAEASTAS